MSEYIEIRAKPGPQTDFMSCEADIAIFGGKAGGGKTFCCVLDSLRWTHLPRWNAAFFRRDKERFDAIWEEMEKLYPLRGGVGAKNALRWRFPQSGARVQCFGLRGLEVDREKHRGPRYACEYFEELTEISEADFFFLVSRNGSTIDGFRSYVRATCNPRKDSWVRAFLDWWIDSKGWPIPERCGVLRWFIRGDDNRFVWANTRDELLARFPSRAPLSVTFIPTKDIVEELGAEYRARLDALPGHQRRADLLGNWNATEARGDWFKRENFKIVPFLPPSAGKLARRLRFWDLAATKPHPVHAPDPDWTRGTLLGWTDTKNLVIEGLDSLRDGPGEVEARVLRMAQADNDFTDHMHFQRTRPVPVEVGLFQDPAQAGKHQFRTFSQRLSGFIVNRVPARQDVETMTRVWAPWTHPDQGRVYVLDGPHVDEIMAELEDFPNGAHDDITASISGGVQALTMRTQTRSIHVRGA